MHWQSQCLFIYLQSIVIVLAYKTHFIYFSYINISLKFTFKIYNISWEKIDISTVNWARRQVNAIELNKRADIYIEMK